MSISVTQYPLRDVDIRNGVHPKVEIRNGGHP